MICLACTVGPQFDFYHCEKKKGPSVTEELHFK
jgi:hypothetical protein